LTEDVKNTKYTIAHSDIESSSSTISTLELPAPQYVFGKSAPENTKDEDAEVGSGRARVAAHQTGEKRESDEEDSDTSCPATPVAGRRKRHRQWRWTLGPVDPETEGQEKVVDEVGVGEEKTEGT